MPTAVTHSLVATLAAGRMPVRFWFLSVLCSLLPDADLLGSLLGIRHEGMFGHRGLSHSLVFALILGLIVSFLADPQRWIRFFWFFFIVTASHGVLDAMTDGGLGVAFFSPFDDTRYLFPFRPIKATPLGLSFFSAHGLDVIWSEFLWIGIPGTIIAAAVFSFRKARFE
jgi:inner membrane protein